MNVDKLIQENGGQKLVGYKVWYVKDKYIEAERHVIHKNGERLRDPTFNADGEPKILFIPDDNQSLGYDARPLRVRRGISLAGKKFESKANATDPPIRRMSEEESWQTMLTYADWQSGQRMSNLFLMPTDGDNVGPDKNAAA